MIKYAVIGDPISHSRSPGMQNAAFEKAQLGRPYGRIHVLPQDLGSFGAWARENLSGVNITVPHKEKIIPFLDEIDPRAAACGSVNTLKISGGRITGYSTDGIGLEHAVEKNFSIPAAGRTFCFTGCGGACRAAAFHLAAEGAARIFLFNRTVEKAQTLAEDIARHYGNCRLEAGSIADQTALGNAIVCSDVLVQATSLGLHENDPAPFELALLLENRKIAVFDTIYKNTPLLQFCRENDIACAGGRNMLIYQGAASFRLWTGIDPDIEAMQQGFDITPVTDGDGR